MKLQVCLALVTVCAAADRGGYFQRNQYPSDSWRPHSRPAVYSSVPQWGQPRSQRPTDDFSSEQGWPAHRAASQTSRQSGDGSRQSTETDRSSRETSSSGHRLTGRGPARRSSGGHHHLSGGQVAALSAHTGPVRRLPTELTAAERGRHWGRSSTLRPQRVRRPQWHHRQERRPNRGYPSVRWYPTYRGQYPRDATDNSDERTRDGPRSLEDSGEHFGASEDNSGQRDNYPSGDESRERTAIDAGHRTVGVRQDSRDGYPSGDDSRERTAIDAGHRSLGVRQGLRDGYPSGDDSRERTAIDAGHRSLGVRQDVWDGYPSGDDSRERTAIDAGHRSLGVRQDLPYWARQSQTVHHQRNPGQNGRYRSWRVDPGQWQSGAGRRPPAVYGGGRAAADDSDDSDSADQDSGERAGQWRG